MDIFGTYMGNTQKCRNSLTDPISENEMYSFCVKEQMGLAYHLEGLRVPLVVRVPQVGNHCPRKSIKSPKNSYHGLKPNKI